MKTLILNGSPHENDDTAALIKTLTERLRSEVWIINCYTADITACTDCRCCRERIFCPINDEMQTVYSFLSECDNVVLASPVHYGELSAMLLKAASRFQMYSSALIFRREALPVRAKRGAVILVQGGSGGSERAFETAKLIFQSIGIKDVSPLICCRNTDSLPASADEKALADIGQLAEYLNKTEPKQVPAVEAAVTMSSTPQEKIALFRSLFRGREDVYALRWHNVKTGKSGYSPACANKWVPDVCGLPKVRCADCKYRSFAKLNDKKIFAHLSGKDELGRDVIGIYPMLPDETTNFLAIDFDDGDWKADISAVRKVCESNGVPCAVERSRSGEGGHLWVFFESPVSAAKARKLGSGLLTQAMKERHEIKFGSYDRMFPNQDTMPSGGFGNLIALPLQKQAVRKGNSVFVDEKFRPFPDQWAYLSTVKRIDERTADGSIEKLCGEKELGELFEDDPGKPWEIKFPDSSSNMFPEAVNAVLADRVYITKTGISQGGLNRIKRLASFKNPEFYKAQAMRMPTYDKPRIISLADETDEYIILPRGCGERLENLLAEHSCKLSVRDERITGRSIDVSFNGELRPDQEEAVKRLAAYDNGVLAATTAFGKTVAAIGLIAERKVNTLILVHTQALLQQWKNTLEQFLTVNEALPEQPFKRGRKKKLSHFGQFGGSKNSLTGIVDIAVIQSLYTEGEVKPFINDYGMIIADECHHVSAVSFEAVLRSAHAKYVYGLTATPKRADGHQPVIFMQCGPIRYSANAKEYAAKHSFKHILVPRFTKFRADADNKKLTITDVYKQLSESRYRNGLIADDVKTAVQDGRTPIIISERMSHIERLAELLSDAADNVIILSGQGTAKAKKELLERVRCLPKEQSLILLATGKYAGEGFDEPRLDTLFLTMPISWSGTLSQYVGRLHREYEGKKNVQIYDYIDLGVPMLGNMYKKRLRGYAGLGYAPESFPESTFKTIYAGSFEADLFRDIKSAKKSVMIAGSYFPPRQMNMLISSAEECTMNGVRFVIVTRKSDTPYSHKTEQLLCSRSIEHFSKNRIAHSFCVIDSRAVWYCSGELFGKQEDECVLRIEDEVLAGELRESVEGLKV